MSFSAQHVVPAPREQVWQWHARRGALARLTPPFVFMTPLQQAESLADGTSILGLPGGLKWIARHDLSRFQTGVSFTDVCLTAPMRSLATWRHDHLFKDEKQEGAEVPYTRITDNVDTRIPAHAMNSLFAYRQQQLIKDFEFLTQLKELGPHALPPAVAEQQAVRPLVFAITGSRGGVGRALTAQLTTAGHQVIQLVRANPKPGQRLWRPHLPSPELLEGVDVLIHLAGEPIFGRFNSAHKAEIRDSRVGPTRLLAQVAAHTPGLSTMVCASAIGFYGSVRGDEELTEAAPRGEGFLADVVEAWEDACAPARNAGKRVVNVRTGIALSGNTGLLPILRALFSTGLGGSFGKGEFWYSWIALDDLTDIYFRAAVDPQLNGAINAVSPTPILNKEFVSALGEELKRPAVVPIPTIGPALLLGKEGARELALANQRVLPTKLQQVRHSFRYESVDAALAHELGGEELWGSKSQRG
ncbi:TIGR01777 family oxidoreductase [Corynebacterium striatum]|uniref:TIGR01777 family oxidoreductase n=1 Tax=Corynebacterium striatum TaxID=43770 RepID=UPI000D7614CD|nr:TIGR01777 family oxidoreductase [Corynebacterium striatum]PXY05208.1 TIGR01777 family protein [Corynebacterium striatum]